MASTGLTVALIKALGGGIDPAAVEQAVADWLDENPEAVQTTVKINGTSITDDGVANIPIAGASDFGVVKVRNTNDGLYILQNDNTLRLYPATSSDIKNASAASRPIVTTTQHDATFYGLATASGDTTQKASNNSVGTYTETAKSKISDMLNAPESVSGSTPSITAKSGIRYICGECSTLTITVPASGIIDVVFESGSTPTVLTVTPTKSGVSAVKWANGFDPTSLDANTVYEINIADGEFGVGCAWT